MILTEPNFSFVVSARDDPSWVGKVKYHLCGRISTSLVSFSLLLEAIGRVVVACLVAIASLGMWQGGMHFAGDQMKKANRALWICTYLFNSLFHFRHCTETNPVFRNNDFQNPYQKNTQQYRDFQFAENCCSFPKLAVTLKEFYGLDTPKACQLINQYLQSHRNCNSISLQDFRTWAKL